MSIRKLWDRYLQHRRPKIFIVGMNKTGTTSVKKALGDLGFNVGDQRTAEQLLDEIIAGDYSGLIRYCNEAEAFQDIPFSCPGVYRVLDREFPGSRFILTIRDSPELWYHSLLAFHSKVFGFAGQSPNADDLRRSTVVNTGWAYRCMNFIFPDLPLYDKEGYIKVYVNHSNQVKSYFKARPDDLLVLNLSAPEAYQAFCKFLRIRPMYPAFPWENRTSTSEIKSVGH